MCILLFKRKIRALFSFFSVRIKIGIFLCRLLNRDQFLFRFRFWLSNRLYLALFHWTLLKWVVELISSGFSSRVVHAVRISFAKLLINAIFRLIFWSNIAFASGKIQELFGSVRMGPLMILWICLQVLNNLSSSSFPILVALNLRLKVSELTY